MLPTLSLPVKAKSSALLKEQAAIWLSLGGLSLLLWATGAEAFLAHALYTPNPSHALAKAAWFARQWGALPGMLMAVAGLGLMVWPRLWHTRPLLYRTAVVFALTAILGAGLFNQIIVKSVAERPRPRETILIAEGTPPPDAFSGNSMPSGHAAMGFLLTAPYFPLRRRYPKLAGAALVGGLALGGLIGFSRIVLGAHYVSDVLIAAAISLSASSLLTAALTRWRRVSPALLALGTLLAGVGYVAGNRFTDLTLTYQIPQNQPFRSLQLPCPVSTVVSTQPGLLTVRLSGYGAPLSNLQLHEKNGIISINSHYGLYHGFTCTATLAVPGAE